LYHTKSARSRSTRSGVGWNALFGHSFSVLSGTSLAVVVPSLKEVDPIIANKIDQAMLLRDAPRPNTCAEILQWFWFPNTAERVAHDRFD
jgi:hypothetical protein